QAFLEGRGSDSIIVPYNVYLFCFESLDVILEGFIDRLLAWIEQVVKVLLDHLIRSIGDSQMLVTSQHAGHVLVFILVCLLLFDLHVSSRIAFQCVRSSFSLRLVVLDQVYLVKELPHQAILIVHSLDWAKIGDDAKLAVGGNAVVEGIRSCSKVVWWRIARARRLVARQRGRSCIAAEGSANFD
ncbi:unnamed protein product, partial [Prunus brigantina]